MHRRSESQRLHHESIGFLRPDSEISNTVLGSQYTGLPISAVAVGPEKFDCREVKGEDRPTKSHKPKASSQSIAPMNNPRSKSKRSERSSRLRVYIDHLRSPSPTPTTSAAPSQELKNLPLLPLISNLPPAPASKLRRRERFRSWRPFLYTLSESLAIWLILYFFFNLSLTLYNKSVLINFPYPYTLTALHALCSAAGSSVLLRSSPISYLIGWPTSSPLNRQEIKALVSFSVLFTVNIATSNISLDLVTVPFHQVVRAMTPLFTIMLSKILLGSRSSRDKVISLIPVVAGVAFATYGDYDFTYWGFFLTLLGAVISALKTIVTNIMQTSSQATVHAHTPFPSLFQSLQPRPTLSTLSPLEHLHLLSPLAFVQSLFLAQVTGEFKTMMSHSLQPRQCIYLIINGFLAFGLNVASFGANKRVGAVTMCVAANVKQVLTMLAAVAMFNVRITAANTIGIALTLGGGAWYTAVDMREKKRNRTLRQSISMSKANDVKGLA